MEQRACLLPAPGIWDHRSLAIRSCPTIKLAPQALIDHRLLNQSLLDRPWTPSCRHQPRNKPSDPYSELSSPPPSSGYLCLPACLSVCLVVPPVRLSTRLPTHPRLRLPSRFPLRLPTLKIHPYTRAIPAQRDHYHRLYLNHQHRPLPRVITRH